ncbi:hypothetical protein [Actinomadura verrucosospora]
MFAIVQTSAPVPGPDESCLTPNVILFAGVGTANVTRVGPVVAGFRVLRDGPAETVHSQGFPVFRALTVAVTSTGPGFVIRRISRVWRMVFPMTIHVPAAGSAAVCGEGLAGRLVPSTIVRPDSDVSTVPFRAPVGRIEGLDGPCRPGTGSRAAMPGFPAGPSAGEARPRTATVPIRSTTTTMTSATRGPTPEGRRCGGRPRSAAANRVRRSAARWARIRRRKRFRAARSLPGSGGQARISFAAMALSSRSKS